MQPIAILILLTFYQAAQAQQSVSEDGWNGNSNNTPSTQNKSWIVQNYHYIIIIVAALVLGLLTWYIVRSVKSMRRRLARENDQQRQMMQNIGVADPYLIPESVPIPMDYEKSGQHPSFTPHQQPIYTHRY